MTLQDAIIVVLRDDAAALPSAANTMGEDNVKCGMTLSQLRAETAFFRRLGTFVATPPSLGIFLPEMTAGNKKDKGNFFAALWQIVSLQL